MQQLKILIDLTRLNKPIGIMLLFWPCAWGLTYTNINNSDKDLYIYYLILFFLGSVLMRSAGCIFNDIIDRNIDKKVSRTKKRPIPSGKVTVFKSLIYVVIFCLIALIILLQFNYLTIVLGLGSMFLAFTYPLMKRVTYWPQLFLGLTFNWGIVMAWTSINNNISIEILILYMSAIFWTLGYDTIYGAQDMSDDEIIGIKSTSIKFKENINIFVGVSYGISMLTILYLFKNQIGLNLTTLFIILFAISLIYQIKNFNSKLPETCLKAFKFNNLSGLLMFLGILLQ